MAVQNLYDNLELQELDDGTYDDDIKTRPRAQDKDPLQSDIRRYKRVAVGVGLLCAVLALLNVAVPLYLHRSHRLERDQLLTTKQKGQLESCNQLQASFDELLTRQNNLTGQKGQLQTSCNQLQSRHNQMTEQKEQLQTSFDQLQNRHNQLTQQEDQLQTSYNQLQTSFDQLQTRHNQLTQRKDQLQTSYNQLQASYNILTKQKGQLQSSSDQLQTRFDQLQSRHNNVTEERDAMTMRLCASLGWQKFDRGCYYISTGTKTWDESRQWCRDRQSDLIIIKSKAKQDFVASFNKRIWIGLTDRDREGVFHWVDGTPLTTPTYWYPGEPHADHNDPANDHYPNAETDCVEYYDGSDSDSSNKGWNDVPCSNPYMYWMCERAVC